MSKQIIEAILAKLDLDQIDTELVLELDPMYNTERVMDIVSKDSDDELVRDEEASDSEFYPYDFYPYDEFDPFAIGKSHIRAEHRRQSRKHHKAEIFYDAFGNEISRVYSDQHRRKFTNGTAQYYAGRNSWDGPSAKERRWNEQFHIDLDDVAKEEVEKQVTRDILEESIRKLEDEDSNIFDEMMEIKKQIDALQSKYDDLGDRRVEIRHELRKLI